MPSNGITPPRVIARESADILATMGVRSSIRGDANYDSKLNLKKIILNNIFA